MITRHLRILGASCLLAVAAFPFQAKALDFFTGSVDGVDLGDAGDAYHFAIFSISGNVGISASGSEVIGTVGAAGATALVNNSGIMDGNVWLQSGGTYAGNNPTSGHSVIKGTDGSILTTGAANAQTASTTAAGLSATSGLTTYTNGQTIGSSISFTSGSETIAWTATGAGANSTDVLKLTTFSLASNTLTLSGSSSDHFIIDVATGTTGYFKLSNATVALSGGLTAQDVLFDVTGAGLIGASVAGTSTLNGVLLAPSQAVTVSGTSTVNGEVIAQAVTMSGTSKINNPTFSP